MHYTLFCQLRLFTWKLTIALLCVNDNNAQDVNGWKLRRGCVNGEEKNEEENCDVWAWGGNEGGNTWFSDSFFDILQVCSPLFDF